MAYANIQQFSKHAAVFVFKIWGEFSTHFVLSKINWASLNDLFVKQFDLFEFLNIQTLFPWCRTSYLLAECSSVIFLGWDTFFLFQAVMCRNWETLLKILHFILCIQFCNHLGLLRCFVVPLRDWLFPFVQIYIKRLFQ